MFSLTQLDNRNIEERFKIIWYTKLLYSSQLIYFFWLCHVLGWMYPPGNANTPQAYSSGTNAAPSLANRTSFLRRSGHKSKTSSASKFHQQSSNFANYQNCTIVRSHTSSHANYGAKVVKAAPKILIFPIFVQVFAGFGCLVLLFFYLQTDACI